MVQYHLVVTRFLKTKRKNKFYMERENNMKIVRRERPSGITTLACFEFLGAISCFGLLFFTPIGSRDFIALLIGGFLGLLVVYSLWTVQFWAFWFTACYESMEIAYELYLIAQPEYRGLHLVGPIFGILMSAITIGYIFLDRSVKPVFRRTLA
jgi:ABC-type enterobactin transport system permease subunit